VNPCSGQIQAFPGPVSSGPAVLKATARQRPAADQEELDLGLERTEPARRGALPLLFRAAWPVRTLPRRHADVTHMPKMVRCPAHEDAGQRIRMQVS
jgi:hypothetical protein